MGCEGAAMELRVMIQEPRGEHVLRREQSASVNPSQRSGKRGTSIQNKESIGFTNKDS